MHRAVSIAVLFAAALASGACRGGPSDARAAEVAEILEAHLEHEDALLALLEEHRDEPEVAAAELARYVADHRAALDALGAQRRRLEGEPRALAVAMRHLAPELGALLDRRRALTERHPALMAREDVRAALATLDAL